MREAISATRRRKFTPKSIFRSSELAFGKWGLGIRGLSYVYFGEGYYKGWVWGVAAYGHRYC